jgi:hypothetical protein
MSEKNEAVTEKEPAKKPNRTLLFAKHKFNKELPEYRVREGDLFYSLNSEDGNGFQIEKDEFKKNYDLKKREV